MLIFYLMNLLFPAIFNVEQKKFNPKELFKTHCMPVICKKMNSNSSVFNNFIFNSKIWQDSKNFVKLTEYLISRNVINLLIFLFTKWHTRQRTAIINYWIATYSFRSDISFMHTQLQIRNQSNEERGKLIFEILLMSNINKKIFCCLFEKKKAR